MIAAKNGALMTPTHKVQLVIAPRSCSRNAGTRDPERRPGHQAPPSRPITSA